MVIERRKYSPPQVAKLLGISTQKVFGWIKSGELRAINVGDGPKHRPRYLIDRDDLARFEASRVVVVHGGDSTTKIRRCAPQNVKQYF